MSRWTRIRNVEINKFSLIAHEAEQKVLSLQIHVFDLFIEFLLMHYNEMPSIILKYNVPRCCIISYS